MRAKAETVLEQMRGDQARAELIAGREVKIEFFEGTAEKIPLPDRSLDVLTVAQAFHWFDGEKALREIHRVLKPGGVLLLIWNVRDENVEWIQAMTELMEPYESNAPRYRSMKWREAFERTSLFSQLEMTMFQHTSSGSIEMMLDRVASVSFVASLTMQARDELLARMRGLYEKQLRSDRGAETLHMPYETRIYVCHRI